ncbi:MAG: ATP-binding protein [Pseudomonadota bacterium]
MSFSELLARALGDDLPDKASVYLDHIGRNALLMRTLVQDLLRLSRAGNSPLATAPLALDACLDRALRALGATIEEHGAEIRRAPLPEITGDAGLLAQLFQNLVGNALKFVPPGRRPVVDLAARRDGDHWVVSVADNGIGIDPAYAQRIFAPFQRLHRAEEYPGSGIGLAICRRVVERHGGTLWVQPGPEQGSIFQFTLPASPPSSPHEP